MVVLLPQFFCTRVGLVEVYVEVAYVRFVEVPDHRVGHLCAQRRPQLLVFRQLYFYCALLLDVY